MLRTLILLHVLLLLDYCSGQSAFTNGVTIVSQVFSKSDQFIQQLPAPLPTGYYDDNNNKNNLVKNGATYVRTVGFLPSRSLGADKLPASLKNVSTHTGDRQNDRISIVIWTYLKITDKTSEVFVQAIQDYIAKVLDAKQSGNDIPTLGIKYDKLFLLGTTEELEIELYSVELDNIYRNPPCFGGAIRKSQTSTGLPCPDMVLMDTQSVSVFKEFDVLSTWNRFFDLHDAATRVRIESDFIDEAAVDFRQDNNWLGIPLFSEMKLAAFNRTTFQKLGLKLPPPHGDWGAEYWKTWTWSQMADYARKIKDSGYPNGFKFAGSWDDETRFISMIAAESSGGSITRADSNLLDVRSPAFKSAIGAVFDKLWLSNNAPANSDFIRLGDDFQKWMKEPLTDPRVPQSFFCCQEPVNNILGLSIMSSSVIRQGFLISGGQPEVLPAFVPGPNAVLNIIAMGLTKASQSPTLGFYLMQFMISKDNPFLNRFAQAFGSLPPFKSAGASAFQSEPWRVSREQFNRKQLWQAPATAIINPNGVSQVKPFRLFMMELVHKQVGMDNAVARLQTALGYIQGPECNFPGPPLQYIATTCGNDFKHNIESYRWFASNFSCRPTFTQTSLLNVTSVPCSLVPISSPSGIATFVVSGIGCLLAVLFAILTCTRRKSDAIMQHSMTGMLLILLGAIFVFVSNIFYVNDPESLQCIARIAFVFVGFILFNGSIAMKAKMMRNAFVAGSPKTPRTNLMFFLTLIICVIGGALVIAWIFVPEAPAPGFIVNPIQNRAVVLSSACTFGNTLTQVALLVFSCIVVLLAFVFTITQPGKKGSAVMAVLLQMVALIALVSVGATISQDEPERNLSIIFASNVVTILSLLLIFVPILKQAKKGTTDDLILSKRPPSSLQETESQFRGTLYFSNEYANNEEDEFQFESQKNQPLTEEPDIQKSNQNAAENQEQNMNRQSMAAKSIMTYDGSKSMVFEDDMTIDMKQFQQAEGFEMAPPTPAKDNRQSEFDEIQTVDYYATMPRYLRQSNVDDLEPVHSMIRSNVPSYISSYPENNEDSKPSRYSQATSMWTVDYRARDSSYQESEDGRQ